MDHRFNTPNILNPHARDFLSTTNFQCSRNNFGTTGSLNPMVRNCVPLIDYSNIEYLDKVPPDQPHETPPYVAAWRSPIIIFQLTLIIIQYQRDIRIKNVTKVLFPTLNVNSLPCKFDQIKTFILFLSYFHHIPNSAKSLHINKNRYFLTEIRYIANPTDAAIKKYEYHPCILKIKEIIICSSFFSFSEVTLQKIEQYLEI